MAFVQQAGGVAQFRPQPVQAVGLLGAAGRALQPVETMLFGHGWCQALRCTVALRLQHQHRRPRPHHGPHMGQPVRQVLVVHGDAVVDHAVVVLQRGCPHQQVDRPVVQEQAVGAQVDVLAAEVHTWAFRPRSGSKGSCTVRTPWVLGTLASNGRPCSRRTICVLPARPLPSTNSLRVSQGALPLVCRSVCQRSSWGRQSM